MNNQQQAPFTPPNNKSKVNNSTSALAQRQGVSESAYTDAYLRAKKLKKPKLLTELLTRVESYRTILEAMKAYFTPHGMPLDLSALDDYLKELRSKLPNVPGLSIQEEERLMIAVYQLRNELVPMIGNERFDHLNNLINKYSELLVDINIKLNP
jgi:hypothetical protein